MKTQIGRQSERIVAQALIASGFEILFRNAKCMGIEIDIVALRGGQLCLVEVKTINAAGFFGPVLTSAQHRRLQQVYSRVLKADAKAIFQLAMVHKSEIRFVPLFG